MSCRLCQSKSQSRFGSEINIHFPGLKGLDRPNVMVFPQLVVCLDCGFTEFLVPEAELHLLSDGVAADGAVA